MQCPFYLKNLIFVPAGEVSNLPHEKIALAYLYCHVKRSSIGLMANFSLLMSEFWAQMSIATSNSSMQHPNCNPWKKRTHHWWERVRLALAWWMWCGIILKLKWPQGNNRSPRVSAAVSAVVQLQPLYILSIAITFINGGSITTLQSISR